MKGCGTAMGKRKRPNIGCFAALWAAVLVLGVGLAATAAARVGTPLPEAKPLEERLPDPLVERMQKALTAIELYKGPVDGLVGPQTDTAIRTFQRRSGFKADGVITEKLVRHAETAPQVNVLLKRLDRARQDKTEAARQALLNHPATRNLLGGGGGGEVADPTRDAAPCFRKPTARCLLAEASESAKAIHKDDMRDWALGEILAAQAKAGLTDDALATVRRIHDPRLIMVALREIAEAQATAGRGDDAIAATVIIPDTLRRAEALASIAAIQVEQGNDAGARQAARRLIGELTEIEEGLKRVAFHARAATVLVLIGDDTNGMANLKAAAAFARSGLSAAHRGAALRHVAAALAEMGRTERAIEMLDEVGNDANRTPVLVAAATAQSEAGDTGGALKTAGTIEKARYRAVVLSRIAVTLAKSTDSGGLAGARKAVEKAIDAAGRIKFPYARAFANSHIAMALMEIGKAAGGDAFVRSVETAQEVEDDPLRAQTLWTIAAERRLSGDETGAAETETLARQATNDIRSRLSRVWMFGDFALNRAAVGEVAAAWDALHAGLRAAETIHNAWARARVLGKLADTLTELIRTEEEARAVTP